MLAAVPRCARALIVASLTLAGAACGGSDAGPTSVTPPAPNPTIVDWTPCPAPYAAPLWVAQQDGTGNWSVVTPTGSSYRFSFLSSKGAIAWVSGPAPYFNSYVYYGTTADLAAYAAGTCNATQRNLTVSVNALASGEQASVSMGWNSGSATGPGTRSVNFSALNSVTDLVAVLSRPGAPAARAIMRRALPASTTSIDPIDFSSAEAFDLEHPGLTVSGISGEPVTFGQWYYGTNGSRHAIYYGDASAVAPSTYAALPAAKQQAGDLHELFAYTTTALGGSVTRTRSVDAYFHDGGSHTVSLPDIPASAPSVSVVSTSPYAKLRGQLAVPTGAKMIELFYYRTEANASASLSIYASTAYLGSSTADLTVPDLSSLAGWQSAFFPQASGTIQWGMYSYSWTSSTAGFFGRPLDGSQTTYVAWRSTVTP